MHLAPEAADLTSQNGLFSLNASARLNTDGVLSAFDSEVRESI
jgi:hypothetical protein